MIDRFIVYCAGCGEPIEACVGVESDWMHSATRREACLRGGLARPDGPAAVEKRKNQGRKKASA